jgi:hypothetical protein
MPSAVLQVKFSWVGFCMIMASCFSEGAKVVMQQMLLSNLRFEVIEGVYYFAPAVCFW